MTYLLASSNTLDGITSCIVKFYCGQLMRVDGEKVIRSSDDKVLDGVRVIKKKNRYRFERVQS